METNPNTVVAVRHLDVYQKNHLVLSDVNVEVARGEFVYLIGKTGTGKSSLLRTLYADIPVQAGEVEVCQCRLDWLKGKDIPFLRRRIGIVFQDFQLLMDRNIHDNLMFVLKATAWKDKAAMERRIEEVLDKVGLRTQAYKMPYRLSGGEQQRVAIARALLNDPELILADEPTGNLDPDTSEEIMRLLVEISKGGCAVLLATHDFLMISKFPSRILMCADGRIKEETF